MAMDNLQSDFKDTARDFKESARNLKNKALSGEVKEGQTTSAIETVTGKVPSIAWLGFAIASMAASAVIMGSARKKEYANFVGLWAPSFLLIGIYNKLVKLERSSINPQISYDR